MCDGVANEFRQYGWAKTQLIQCLSLLKELNGYICTQCNGWGHKANDGYKNAKGKLIKHCATSKLVDMAFESAKKRNLFNIALGKESKRNNKPMDAAWFEA